MPIPLTAAETRAPSSATKKIARVTGWTTLFSFLIPMLIPGLQPTLLIPLAGLFASLVSATGSEIRNHQHTYEDGGKRSNLIQNGFVEALLNLLGTVL